MFKIDIDGPLPHNKEIKVQNGGMLGVQKLLLSDVEQVETVNDISDLMFKSIEVYGSVDGLPYNLIMPSVNNYKTRPKRQPRKK